MGSHFVKTGLGNDANSATYYDTPQQAVAAFGQQSKAPEQMSNTYTPGLQFLQGGALAQDPETPPTPSFLQTQNSVTPKYQTPSFLQAQNSPQLAQKSETKMGKLFQILSTVASGGAAGAGAPTVGQGFAQAQHADLQRKNAYNQQQQQLIQNQRQAQADKNSQAEADRQAAEAPLNTTLKQQTIQANQRALAVKNQTPAEILAQRTQEADAQHLQGDIRAKYILEGKTPEDFGKKDEITPFQAAQLAQGNQRLGYEKDRVGIEYQKMQNDKSKKDVSEQAIDRAAQALASGDLTPLKDISSMRSDQRLLIYDKAKQLNPKFNTAEVNRKIKMVDDFTNGPDGKNLQSFGTFLEHAGEASDVVNSYRLSNSPLMNKSINWIRKNASADPAYQQYEAALEPVRKEFEGFLLGGKALYGDDRRAAETILSDDATPAQQQAALKQMGHTVKARYNEANYRYKRTVGSDLENPISPEALAGAHKIGVEIGTGAPPSGGNEIHYKIVNGQLVAQ